MKENKGEQPDQEVEKFIKSFYDNKHPHLYNLRCGHGFLKDEVIELIIQHSVLAETKQPSKVQEELKKENELLEAREVAWQNKHSFLMEEIKELKAWKESAISVMPDMQAIGKALNIPLGQSVHDKILPGIERLKALIEQEDAVEFLEWLDEMEWRYDRMEKSYWRPENGFLKSYTSKELYKLFKEQTK